jgi:predicted nuclease with RNAse H fold
VSLRFVGCALAWRPGEAREKVSCLVVIDERGSIIANSFAVSAKDIAGAVEGYGTDRRGVLVGVDAPLAVPNERGTRKIERILSKVALPAYSASRRMFGGEPPSEELLAELEKVGVEYTDYPFPRERDQSAVVEVDSAATLKVLSLERSGAAENGDLAQKLRAMDDPKLRKGNKESRSQGRHRDPLGHPRPQAQDGQPILGPRSAGKRGRIQARRLRRDVPRGAGQDRKPGGRHARRLHGPPPLAREGRLDGGRSGR